MLNNLYRFFALNFYDINTCRKTRQVERVAEKLTMRYNPTCVIVNAERVSNYIDVYIVKDRP